MMKTYIFDKVHELTEKFKRLFVFKKKLQALENFSEATNFEHKGHLKLIRSCLDEGFPDEKDEEYLCHLINRYELKGLDWTHKTKWLKEEIKRRAYRMPKQQPAVSKGPFQFSLFEWGNKQKQQSSSVPVELLNIASKNGQRTHI